MTKKHTPTPWEAGPLMGGGGAGEYALTSLGNYRIGYVSNFNGHEQNAANATFIVRAVNHHGVLVETLRKMLDDSGVEFLESDLLSEARILLAALDADNA